MCNDPKDSSRRRFLGGGLLLGATHAVPYVALCEAIFNSFVRQAYADVSGATTIPRNYINVAAMGAPARYSFDHWVRVNSSDAALVPNPMVATRLVASGANYCDTAYETFYVQNSNTAGIEVPSFFKSSVQTSSANQPLTDLLANMLVIRGYGTGIDGHPGNHTAQLMPLNGAPSISGTAADNASAPFAAVQYPNRGGYTTFSSANGKGLAVVGDPALQSLMQAFGPNSPNAQKASALKAAHANTVTYYQQKLNSLAQQGDPTSQSLAVNVDNARKLMKRGISDITAYWTPALNRYQTIINNALQANSGIYGINDKPIVNSGGSNSTGLPTDSLFHVYNNGASPSLPTATGFDVRTSLANATMSNFASGLALAEYLISQGLGSVLEISLPQIDGVVAQIKMGSSTATSNTSIVHDMHELGAVMTVTYTNALYRAFSAGILELSNQLKKTSIAGGTNAWNETIVHLTSDFGRIPRSDGTGSDHGFNQMTTSVYSGCIAQGPFVVGNVTNGGSIGGYDGSQGLGAAIDGYSQLGRPTPLMAASTITAMMRVPKNPYQNLAAPLIQLNNDQVVYTSIGQGKTVTG